MRIGQRNPIPGSGSELPDLFGRGLRNLRRPGHVPAQVAAVAKDAVRAQQKPTAGLGQELPRLYAENMGQLKRVGDLPLHLAAVAKDAVHINGLFMDAARLRRIAAARECQLPSRVFTYFRG